jgi:hypothetical protein
MLECILIIWYLKHGIYKRSEINITVEVTTNSDTVYSKHQLRYALKNRHGYHTFPVTQQPKFGFGRSSFEIFKSQTIRRTQPVGLSWKSDQLVSQAAPYTTHNKHKRRTPCRQRYSNPPSQQSSGFKVTPSTARPAEQATAIYIVV